MSQTLPVYATPSSNFQLIFNIAMRAYEKQLGKQTKQDLLLHPLACQPQKCDTPASILAVLQSQADDLDKTRMRRMINKMAGLYVSLVSV